MMTLTLTKMMNVVDFAAVVVLVVVVVAYWYCHFELFEFALLFAALPCLLLSVGLALDGTHVFRNRIVHFPEMSLFWLQVVLFGFWSEVSIPCHC